MQQGAETRAAARALASFACPSCGSCWDEAQRIKANLQAKVVHEGQSVTVEGNVAGPTGHVLDYGRIEVASEDLGVEQALLVTLRQFKEMILAGWQMAHPVAP